MLIIILNWWWDQVDLYKYNPSYLINILYIINQYKYIIRLNLTKI